MMHRYVQAAAERKVAALQAKHPASSFLDHVQELRKDLRQTYPCQRPRRTVPAARLIGMVSIDGVEVEKRLLHLGSGRYSTAWIYIPPTARGAAAGRYATLLMLPGHGDPGWSPAVQSRCLGFARQGYLVMLVEPFGQDERGDSRSSTRVTTRSLRPICWWRVRACSG